MKQAAQLARSLGAALRALARAAIELRRDQTSLARLSMPKAGGPGPKNREGLPRSHRQRLSTESSSAARALPSHEQQINNQLACTNEETGEPRQHWMLSNSQTSLGEDKEAIGPIKPDNTLINLSLPPSCSSTDVGLVSNPRGSSMQISCLWRSSIISFSIDFGRKYCAE